MNIGEVDSPADRSFHRLESGANGGLRHRSCPAAISMHLPNCARQREVDLAAPILLVGSHAADQPAPIQAGWKVYRQAELLEESRDAGPESCRGQPQLLCQLALDHQPQRNRLAMG